MKGVIKNWNTVRWFRFALGLAILIPGIIQADLATIFIGALFGGMAVFNFGCCGPNGCSINATPDKKSKRVSNEKLDNK